MWEDTGFLLARLVVDGPLVYIGLVMALDPAGFVRFTGLIAVALRNFEHRLQGRESQEWWREQETVPAGRVTLLGLRTAGWGLVAGAFLHLAGVLGPQI